MITSHGSLFKAGQNGVKPEPSKRGSFSLSDSAYAAQGGWIHQGSNFTVPHPLRHFLYKVTDLVKAIGLQKGAGRMQNLLDIQRDALSASLDAIGGEPLAGSGFETEEPESGFSATNEVDE
jgi:hypothetical protein